MATRSRKTGQRREIQLCATPEGPCVKASVDPLVMSAATLGGAILGVPLGPAIVIGFAFAAIFDD